MKKTNAMRILDSNKIDYKVREYKYDDESFSGEYVANMLGEDPASVFKTLVTESGDGNIFVFLVSVKDELDLKKAAAASKVKSLSMLKSKDLLKTCGYLHGACSPIGMKNKFKTYIDDIVEGQNLIHISGGKRGYQIELKSSDLIELEDISVVDISKN
ncbi:MAG: Cys-tRNA(Pro) deacylase [Finegoldia sp.]|nr:Cys-tRNA(Pro) deacylase [Finegoldia sp.]